MLKTEFEFFPTDDLKYSSSTGKFEKVNTLILKAPFANAKRLFARLHKIYVAAVSVKTKEQQSLIAKMTPSELKEITTITSKYKKENIQEETEKQEKVKEIINILLECSDSTDELFNVFEDILLCCCKCNNDKFIQKKIIDQISYDEELRLLGEYIENFTIHT